MAVFTILAGRMAHSMAENRKEKGIDPCCNFKALRFAENHDRVVVAVGNRVR